MALVNKITGEAVIDGTSHHLVFTAAAFLQAETMLGLTTPEIIQRARSNALGFRELQVLVAAGMEGWASRQPLAPKKAPSPTKALSIIEKAGWYATSQAVGEAILFSTAMGILTDDDRGAETDDDEEGEDAPPGTGPE